MKETRDKKPDPTEEGTLANPWFRSCLEELEAGKLLLLGAGEGRSAVHAALKGWDVEAYDRSRHQQGKALEFAEERGVSIDYEVGEIEDLDPKEGRYDAIASLFVQLPPIARKKLHSRLVKGLRSGGHLILEAFSKGQISYYSGGPPDIDRLYGLEDIEGDLAGLHLKVFREEELDLMEGERNLGPAKLLRVFARKEEEKG